MKKLLLFVLLCISAVANAQKGISYQAVILDPAKIEIPGQDIVGQPLVNGDVSVKFVLLSGTNIQFEEVQQTKTDAYGLVNLIIGSVASTAFNSITWDANQKSLQVFVSFDNGSSYTKVSDQKLTYSPYALFAETAGKLGGTLGITGGGTGATTAVAARANLGLGNVDNTSDVDKPISAATQAALNLKASSTDLVALSTTVNTNTASITSNTTEISLKAPIDSPTFTGTVAGITKSMVGLGSVNNTSDAAKPVSEAMQAALDLKANATDLVALSTTVNTNTASITSNTTEISLKAPIDSPTFTGTVAGITKSMVGLGSVNNTSDAAKPVSEAMQAALDLKANATDLVALSTTVNTNTASITSNTTEISLKAPIESPIFTGLTSASGYKIPNGTSSEYLMADGTVTTGLSTNLSSGTVGILPIESGGTGSNLQNFVDLTNSQTISGTKVFQDNIQVNQINIGSPSTGSQNTMLGAASYAYGSPGSNNTALGFFTLATLSNSGNEGNDNTAVGTNALRQGVSSNGSRNTAIGSASMSNALGSFDNVAIGVNSMNAATGNNNTALGNYSLQNITTARENVAVGIYSLHNSLNGGYNTAIGTNSMRSNISGDVNTAVGHNSLVSNVDGRYNTAIGVQAQESNLSGNHNTALGVAANDRNTTGSNNVVLGAFAGRYIGDGTTYNSEINNSVLIGSEVKPLSNSSSNEIVIGYNAIGNGSNTITLGNSGISNVKTSGTLTAGAVTYPNTSGSNGQVLTTNGSGAASWVSPTNITVGTISSTSNANGATITSGGVLNLAPADASNGGLVTNGTQTFGGNKTFNGNLITGGTLTSGVLDINTYTSFSSGYADPGQDSRQTFTAATSGYLTKLTLKSFSTVSGVTIEIYKGANIASQNSIGGTLLYTSDPINFIPGDLDILFSSGVKLDVGQVYMFRVISNSTLTLGKGYQTPSVNPGLTYSWPSYYLGLEHPYAFKTYISQKNGGNISVGEALTGGNSATSTISGFAANMNTQTGTSYTLLASDNGKIITLNNASAITLTIPALFTGFNCMIVQLGAGEVTLTPSGTTISNRSSYTKTAGTNAIVSLIGLSDTSFISAGDMR